MQWKKQRVLIIAMTACQEKAKTALARLSVLV
jgi:hypothetical protein